MPSMPFSELKACEGDSIITTKDLAVERGKVEEFARAILDDNPAHRNLYEAKKQAFDAIPAPLTFTATKRFPRYRPSNVTDHWGFDLTFDLEHTVHGQKEYEFGRNIVVGDVLSGETTLKRVYQRTGSRGGEMTLAVLGTDFTDQNGEWVLTERSTLIETEGEIPEEDQ
jgi:hypothetical protein